MKKLVTIFALILFSVLIVACDQTDQLPTELLEKVEIGYIEGDNKDRVTGNITLPTTLEGYEDVTVSWTSGNDDYILIEDSVGKVNRQTMNVSLILTAKVSRKEASKDLEFKLTIIALEETTDTDTVKPVISGAVDINHTIGNTAPNYLSGVTATDDVDGTVVVTVDDSLVNLNVAGTYDLVYKAVDSSNNEATITVQVIVKNAEVPVVVETVYTLQYTGSETKNMVAASNNSQDVGLDPALFNVTSDSVGEYNNVVGLNKDGSVRLYAVRTTGDGNSLGISYTGTGSISSIEITFGEGTNGVEGTTKAELKLGTQALNLGLNDLKNTTKTYNDLDITSFSFKNTSMGDVSSQIWIISIEITVSSVSSVGDTTAPVINGAKDINYSIGSDLPNYLDGVSATDNVDGVVAVSFDDSEVDLQTVGIYNLIYYATDKAGNRKEIIVQVTVTEGSEEDLETLVHHFEFANDLQHGYSDSAENAVLKDSVTNANVNILKRRANTAEGSSVLVLSGASASQTTAWIVFNFTTKINKVTFMANAWSDNDLSAISEAKLQTKVGDTWVDVLNLKPLLTTDSKLIELTNVELDTLRIYVDASTGSGNTARLRITDLKMYNVKPAKPAEQLNAESDRNNLSIPTTFIENTTLSLPKTGLKGSTITWAYSSTTNPENDRINLTTGAVTVPSEGQLEVGLVATIKNGEFEYEKSFTVKLGEGEATTVLVARNTTNQSYVKTVGVVTTIYADATTTFIYIEDSSGAILVKSPNASATGLAVGDEVEVKGTKLTENLFAYIGDIRGITKLGTKVVSPLVVTTNQLAANPAKLVSISGLISQAYTSSATSYVLHTNQGSFTILIPSELNQTAKSAIQAKLANLDSGINVNAKAPIYKEGTNNYILVTSASQLLVDQSVDFNSVLAVILENVMIPVESGTISENLNLTLGGNLLFGSTITWVSSNPAVLSHGGVITQGEDDVTLTLTYTITFDGEVVKTEDFTIVVAQVNSYDGYYASLSGKSGEAFNQALLSMIKNTGTQSGSTSQVTSIDRVGNQSYNIYTGLGSYGNREHVVPASKLRDVGAKEDDLHNLRAAVVSVNSTRSNYPFTNAVTGTQWKLVENGKRAFYPGSEHVGDVARIVLYITLRNNIKITEVGNLQMFLDWHLQDPVNEFEQTRNERIFAIQKSRNPFIDHPDLVHQYFS